jgi:hypothetical protein
MEIVERNGRLVAAALGLIILVGAGLRLYHLDRQSITHVEMYVPGIDLPPDLVEYPLPRLTMWKVVSGCIVFEPHPPLYYMMMLIWTHVFGTGVLALRLPTALCGVVSVPLIYALGAREDRKVTGLVAAAMLALNGHQIFFSQFRAYVPASFLGLASTLILLKMTREVSRPFCLIFLYGLTTLMGLAMEIFVWPIFVTQILWVAGKGIQRASMPALMRWQLWIFLVASPLCSLAVYQSWLPSHLAGDVLPFLSQFLEFGFLFEPNYLFPFGPAATTATHLLAVVGLSLTWVSLTSTVEGEVGQISRSDEGTEHSFRPEPSMWLWVFGAFISVVGILMLVACGYHWGGIRTGATLATIVIPGVILLADLLLRRWWPKVHGTGLDLWMKLPAGLASLSGLLAVGPIAMLLVASTVVPMLTSRVALLFTPYLILVASRGLVSLVRRHPRWLLLGIVVAGGHTLSVVHFQHMPMNPQDYKALAQELVSRVKATDLVFVWGNNWVTTPVFYYLKADRYHFVGRNYSQAIAPEPGARVWTVTWGDADMSPDMIDALKGHRPAEEFTVRGARVVLYEPTVGGQNVRHADRDTSSTGSQRRSGRVALGRHSGGQPPVSSGSR